jgi:hypothetical protein
MASNKRKRRIEPVFIPPCATISELQHSTQKSIDQIVDRVNSLKLVEETTNTYNLDSSTARTIGGIGGGGAGPGDIPSSVRPIGGAPFLVTQSDDGLNAIFDVEYDPPSPVGVFTGISAHWVPDGSLKPSAAMDFDYLGNREASDSSRRGKFRFVIPEGATELSGRLYLTARSKAYKVPLVLYGHEGASPSVPVTIPAVGTGGAPQVSAASTASVWYKASASGRVFGFEGKVVPPAARENSGGWNIYLHWIEGWNGDLPIYDPRYLQIDSVGRDGGDWHANEPGFDLRDNWSQQVDVVYVPRNLLQIENAAKESAFSIRLTVSSQEEDTPRIQGTAQVWTLESAGGRVFGFGGTVDSAAVIYLHWIEGWDGATPIYDRRYLEVWDTLTGGTWTSDPNGWTLRANYSQQCDVVFKPRIGGAIDPDPAHWLIVRVTVSGTPLPDNVVDFAIGTAEDNGTYTERPTWDAMNERLVWEWGCFLPGDVSNLGGVAVFFKRPTGGWMRALNSTDWVAPIAEGAYQDAFAVSGPDLPKTPETWTFRCCVADKQGTWKTNPDGSPDGPEIAISTIAPNQGIGAGNIADSAMGPGLAKSADQLLANVAGVLGFEAGAIKLNVGAGVQDYLGALYAKVAQGLGFDASGNVQIPTYGVGQNLLANSPIIDAARLVQYAVSQMHLENSQIINSARIVDLAVLQAKIGLQAVGAAQIANASITDAKIVNLSVSKLEAGTAVFNGNLIMSNNGNVVFSNNGYVKVNNYVDTYTLYVGSPLINQWVMGGSSLSNISSSAWIAAGTFRKITDSGHLDGQTAALPYKKADGTDGTLYFNGGIITQYN